MNLFYQHWDPLSKQNHKVQFIGYNKHRKSETQNADLFTVLINILMFQFFSMQFCSWLEL